MAARISLAFHDFQSSLCGNPSSPVVRPAATIRTASRSSPHSRHTARNLIVRETDGTSSACHPSSPPAAWAYVCGSRGVPAVSPAGSYRMICPVRYDVIRIRPHASHASAWQSSVECSRASRHACPLALSGHGGTRSFCAICPGRADPPGS